MSHWNRIAPFSSDHQPRRLERWEYRRNDGRVRAFDVEVQTGKSLDVLALKGTNLNDIRSYSEFLQRTAARLYGERLSAQPRHNCPICRSSLQNAAVELQVFGVPYVRCADCGHVAVGLQADAAALGRVFEESEKHSEAYVDKAAIDTRMKQIIAPKLEWCIRHYRQCRGREPVRLLDVGAGGGHFVAGAQRHGLKAEGFEKSRASRAFAKEAFGIDLRSEEFTRTESVPADIVTFWGLLEYLQEPREFLAAARRAIAPDGMLVVEVPRVDALGTRVQAVQGASIARHMDPTTHINAFSDESLCTALVEEGFGPVAAWYFGMDAYETMIQAALKADDTAFVSAFSSWIPVLQQSADIGRQCDDVIVAAVSMRE